MCPSLIDTSFISALLCKQVEKNPLFSTKQNISIIQQYGTREIKQMVNKFQVFQPLRGYLLMQTVTYSHPVPSLTK